MVQQTFLKFLLVNAHSSVSPEGLPLQSAASLQL